MTAKLPHVNDRTRAFHDEIQEECKRRLSELWGRPWTEADLVLRPCPDDRAKRRAIEAQAKRHVRNLRRVLRDAERFLASNPAGTGGLSHAALDIVVPEMALKLELGIKNAVTEASTGSDETVRRSRRSFICDSLDVFFSGNPLDARPQELSLYTMLGGFCPFSSRVERDFANYRTFPTAAAVIAQEAERIRQIQKR